MFFSAKEMGFYTPEIHGNRMPKDAVEIGEGVYRDLLSGQSEGKIITAGDGGAPVLTDPPSPPEE